MEMESLYRKSVTAAAIGVFQRSGLKQDFNEVFQNPKFWAKDTKQAELLQDRATEELNNKFNLPETIKDDIYNLLAILSMEIVAFTHICLDLNCLHKKIMDDLLWDLNGRVNGLESCKKILKRNLDLDTKIRLACIYCLEKDLHDLWLTKDGYWRRQKDDILFGNQNRYAKHNILIEYWAEHLRKKMSKKVMTCKYSDVKGLGVVARMAILECIIVAAKYFFEKLTPEIKNSILMGTITSEFCSGYPSCISSLTERPLHWKSNFGKFERSHAIYFLVKQYKIENLKCLCRNSLEITMGILKCFLSFHYRHHFFLYDKILLEPIEEEESFYELLAHAASNLQTDPEIYEKIYLAIWNDFCSKDKSAYRLLLLYDDKKELINHLCNGQKYDWINFLVDKHDDSHKAGFFCRYAENIAVRLIPFEDEDTAFLKDMAVRCLLSKDEVIHFRNRWNYSMSLVEKEPEYEDIKDEIKSEVVPLMQDIINYLLQSFGSDKEKKIHQKSTKKQKKKFRVF